MDTSETYIKKCEKAEEIQAQMPELYHSPYQLEKDFSKPIYVITKENYAYISNNIITKQVWLPHQDQLQEMLADKYPKLNEMVYFFWSWMERECAIEILGLTSMEQLWLAFVMKEKYGKVWNGEDWVKEEK